MKKLKLVKTLGNRQSIKNFEIEEDKDGTFILSEVVKDEDVDGNPWNRREAMGFFDTEKEAENQLYKWYL
jgi:hypothetical protein